MVLDIIQFIGKADLKKPNVQQGKYMGRTFDELRRLQQRLEAKRSGEARPLVTKTDPDAAKEKEIHSMDNTYSNYPPLDRPGLREGYTLCVENATRLIADALTLKDAGRHRSAYLILSLALEELGGALQLYEAGGVGVNNWDEWWRRYESHPRQLASPALDLARIEKADERFTLVRDQLVYVDFDKNDGRFKAPPEDDDLDLRELFETEAAYADTILRALPTHAFERWEFEEAVEQVPDIAPSVLYALVEQTASKEPGVSERDLLYAIARDLGRPPDEFAAGYEQWKKATPKARVYVDLLRGVHHKLTKEREAVGGPIAAPVSVQNLEEQQTALPTQKQSEKSFEPDVKDVTFAIDAPSAKNVYVVGSFNHWKISDESRLTRREDGSWEKSVKLLTGIYRYQFVVDGKWIPDPKNQEREKNKSGTFDSIIKVKPSEG